MIVIAGGALRVPARSDRVERAEHEPEPGKFKSRRVNRRRADHDLNISSVITSFYR